MGNTSVRHIANSWLDLYASRTTKKNVLLSVAHGKLLWQRYRNQTRTDLKTTTRNRENTQTTREQVRPEWKQVCKHNNNHSDLQHLIKCVQELTDVLLEHLFQKVFSIAKAPLYCVFPKDGIVTMSLSVSVVAMRLNVWQAHRWCGGRTTVSSSTSESESPPEEEEESCCGESNQNNGDNCPVWNHNCC